MTISVPFAAGRCPSVELLFLTDDLDRQVPIQSQCLERWADGSVRWALLDFQANVATSDGRWHLRLRTTSLRETHTIAIRVTETAGRDVVIDTGRATFRLHRDGFPLRDVTTDGQPVLDPLATGFRVCDSEGRQWDLKQTELTVQTLGPLRVVVRAAGVLVEGSRTRATWGVTLQFFAGSSVVRCDVVLRNPRRATHKDGYWDLGDAGSLHLREAVLTLAGIVPGRALLSADSGTPLENVATPLSLHQWSSGGTNWQSPVHLTADRRRPLDTRGFVGVAGSGTFSGLRATPIVSLERDAVAMTVAVPQFWQNFPKAISTDGTRVSIGLFPATPSESFELQGGEQKTHTCFIGFGPDPITSVPLDWCRRPTRITVPSECYADAGVVPARRDRVHASAPAYEALVAPAFDGDRSFFQKREQIDEYGWRHFGDLYADHEAVKHTGTSLLVSHYNNQYDAIAAFAVRFMQTGDWRVRELMDDLVRHVIDIDVYHTTEDRAAYSGGLFWHTNHYVSADTATHRAYARASALPGGGPSNEHNYTTGLLLHYLMTGNDESARTVVDLAEWVLAMDDGRQSRFRWIDRGPTGLASSTYSPDFHGPGRGAANSINALLDAHRLTGSDSYLTAAEALIRRCIHPHDDPSRHDLLQAERRWSYTVFLQALGKYLEWKRDLGQDDTMAHYASAALMTYATWMAQHERPYLDRPQELEFPTETWAAQDIRKADVFSLALRISNDEAMRARFLERRDFFLTTSLATMARMPTSACTRPLVLLLSNGGRVIAGEDGRPDLARAGSPPEFGEPERFVPQRSRVKRRLIAAMVACGTVAGVALWIWLA